jgi:hypothetical protein
MNGCIRSSLHSPSDLHNARGFNGNGKTYSVYNIPRYDLRNKYGTSVRTVDWDNEGRISVVEPESTHHRLAIFNIYAVNGTNYIYRDPTTDIVCSARHDRILRFNKTFNERVASSRAKFSSDYIILGYPKLHRKTCTVRWPSWLWRQVKVILTLLPGHESGAGSSPVLISIRLHSQIPQENSFFAPPAAVLNLCSAFCIRTYPVALFWFEYVISSVLEGFIDFFS